MDDLISRAAALERMKSMAGCETCNNYNEVRCRACEWDDAMNIVEEAPAVDAVQVVRCAECKYCFDADRYTPYDGEEEWFCAKWKRYVSVYVLDPYRHYCAAGERRDDV